MSEFFSGQPLGLGGYAFWQGVTVDQQPANTDAPVKAVDPVQRQNILGPNGGLFTFGCFPGFEEVPFTTPLLQWQMRMYSAIVLAHTVVTGPILAGTRSIEVVDDGGNQKLAEQMAEDATDDLLGPMEEAFPGAVEDLHFGHWLQEIVWDSKRGRTVPVEAQSFLPGRAVIHVDKYRRFVGFQSNGEFRDSRYAFLSVNEPHIDPVLGYSRNENCKMDWHRAIQSNLNADKIERKAANKQMFLGIPTEMGFVDAQGNPISDTTIAQNYANAATKGDVATYPLMYFTKTDIKNNPDLAKIPAIKIDTVDWGGIGESLKAHLDRLSALNINIIRAWHRPEREAMEAQHGSKADSMSHGQVGITDSELIHARVCRQWDKQVLATWQRTNYANSENIVLRTKPAPLSDPQQDFLQKFALALATDTATGPIVMDNIDVRQSLDRVEVSMKSEEDAEQATADRLAQEKQDKADQAKQFQQQNADPNQVPVNGKKKPMSPRVMKVAKRLASDN